jgi:hypothetical protein
MNVVKRFGRMALIILAVVVAVVSAVYAGIYRPVLLKATQARNITVLREYQGSIARFAEQHGHFPASLEEATGEWIPRGEIEDLCARSEDNWRHKLMYSPVADGYLLVSSDAMGNRTAAMTRHCGRRMRPTTALVAT